MSWAKDVANLFSSCRSLWLCCPSYAGIVGNLLDRNVVDANLSGTATGGASGWAGQLTANAASEAADLKRFPMTERGGEVARNK